MEDLSANQDNPSNVTVTLMEASSSVLPETVQQRFLANQLALLDSELHITLLNRIVNFTWQISLYHLG